MDKSFDLQTPVVTPTELEQSYQRREGIPEDPNDILISPIYREDLDSIALS